MTCSHKAIQTKQNSNTFSLSPNHNHLHKFTFFFLSALKKFKLEDKQVNSNIQIREKKIIYTLLIFSYNIIQNIGQNKLKIHRTILMNVINHASVM